MTATKQKAETKPMNYDLHSVSFSTAGSILVLRMPPPTKDRAEGLYLQTVPNQDFMRGSVLRGDQPAEYDHAREVARRFCETCRTSGFAENFNALTGKPVGDKAYTWTASVFLLLASDLLTE